MFHVVAKLVKPFHIDWSRLPNN